MTIHEFCLRLSIFCASLCGDAEKKDEEEVNPEEIAMIRKDAEEERRRKIEAEFRRLAFGGTMGDVISWGKDEI